MRTIGLLIFPDVEELDFVGPWEVFTAAAMSADDDLRVITVAESAEAVRCAKGMRVLPDATIEEVAALDVLLVPGGQGTRREVDNPRVIDWIRRIAGTASWVTSVCTGALLLHEAGPARDRRVTTHWAFAETLRARGGVTVLDDVRYVRDGNLVTAAGVSAGIDMALWLVGQLYDPDFSRRVRRYIQYDPAPPYQAEA